MDGGAFSGHSLFDAAYVAPDPVAICDRLRAALRADVSGLALMDHHTERLLFLTRCGGVNDTLPLRSAGTFHSHVHRNAAPLAVSDYRTESRAARCSFMQAENLTGFLGVPVFGFGPDPVGCVSVMTLHTRIWGAGEIALARRFAGLVARSLILTAAIEERRARHATL